MAEQLELPDDFRFTMYDGMMTRTIPGEKNRIPFPKSFELIQKLRTWERSDFTFRHISNALEVTIARVRRRMPAYMTIYSQGELVGEYRDNDADGAVGVLYNQLDEAFRATQTSQAEDAEVERQRVAERAEMKAASAAEDLLKRFDLS
jgi:hypothetical protein